MYSTDSVISPDLLLDHLCATLDAIVSYYLTSSNVPKSLSFMNHDRYINFKIQCILCCEWENRKLALFVFREPSNIPFSVPSANMQIDKVQYTHTSEMNKSYHSLHAIILYYCKWFQASSYFYDIYKSRYFGKARHAKWTKAKAFCDPMTRWSA